jgi:hypothetical protein
MRMLSCCLTLVLIAVASTATKGEESPVAILRPVLSPHGPAHRIAGVQEESSPSDRSLQESLPQRRVQNPVVAPSIYGPNRTAEVTEEGLQIPNLIAPTVSVAGIGDEQVPENIGLAALRDKLPLPETAAERATGQAADWSLTAYFWQAPNTFSHPLYFEDVMLERHGLERHRALQPLVSGARFFGTLPMLPYLMTVRPACDFDYHLGYFRPGSCAPALLQRPPYERRAAAVQAATTAGAILLFP